MPEELQPIGVFDSGLGGLTVLRKLMMHLPNERFVYLGDTARVPYGNKSAETVRKYAAECAAFLLDHDVKLIVIACNTASAVALESLRNHLPVPVLGVIEPAARQAAQVSPSGRIGIVGTRATIASGVYEQGIHAHRRDAAVMSQACPLFVPLVEEGWLDTDATRLVARTYLNPLLAQRIDTLVLGCTHYPLLSPLIQEMAPGVRLIDCGEAASVQAAQTLNVAWINGVTDTTRSFAQLYLTDYTPTFQLIARELLGMNVQEPTRVTLSEYSLPDAP